MRALGLKGVELTSPKPTAMDEGIGVKLTRAETHAMCGWGGVELTRSETTAIDTRRIPRS
jgi:hypothetical protein